VDAKATFLYPVGNEQASPKARSKVLTQRDFTVQAGTQRQALLEVYYHPQFYDLELSVESKDAGEVRSHIYKAQTNVDITKYKGAKRI
jgi:hypothetical protein